MQLITPVNIPISTRTIGYKDKILLLGSCFADNVGKKFQEYYFQTKEIQDSIEKFEIEPPTIIHGTRLPQKSKYKKISF